MRKPSRNEVLLIGAVAVAAALRIAAARGELWFDEVWTFELVQKNVQTLCDLVFRFKHENNHMLSSLVVYLVGPNGGTWSYRWPAVLCGIATVALAGWVQRRRGFATALAAVVLCGFSYLLVHYSSEARGYAYQLFFMLLAYAALWEAEETRRGGWEFVFLASCLLGFLAHPLFLTLYLAAQLWTWIPLPRGSFRELAIKAVCRTILPGLFFGWLYWINLRQMTIGGGLKESIFGVIVEMLSLFAGGPFTPPVVYAVALLTIAVSVAALWTIARECRRASLYLFLILIVPAAVILAAGRGDIYPRYFVGSALFLCLLWSELLGSVYQRFADGRVWYRALLVAFVLANGAHVARLIAYQRGHYEQAIATMELRTQGDRIALLVDHPLRHQVMLDFFGPRVAEQKPIDASLPTPEATRSAEWILSHDLDVNFVPPPAIRFETGEEFQLVELYPYAGLSGWNLALYRRAETPQ